MSQQKDAGTRMKSNDKITEMGYCRKCLNETYHLNLEKKDILICYYVQHCACCSEEKNLVHKVRKIKVWKLWLSGAFRKELRQRS